MRGKPARAGSVLRVGGNGSPCPVSRQAVQACGVADTADGRLTSERGGTGAGCSGGGNPQQPRHVWNRGAHTRIRRTECDFGVPPPSSSRIGPGQVQPACSANCRQSFRSTGANRTNRRLRDLEKCEHPQMITRWPYPPRPAPTRDHEIRLGYQWVITIFPRAWPVSLSWCASAAFSRVKVAAIGTVKRPCWARAAAAVSPASACGSAPGPAERVR